MAMTKQSSKNSFNNAQTKKYELIPTGREEPYRGGIETEAARKQQKFISLVAVFASAAVAGLGLVMLGAQDVSAAVAGGVLFVCGGTFTGAFSGAAVYAYLPNRAQRETQLEIEGARERIELPKPAYFFRVKRSR
jgi:hypothetical protein